jgi:hypothetical protein
MINKIKSLFSKPVWQKENPKYVIEKAFTLGGKQYYHINDFINIPCERALMAIQYYNEMEMKVDSKFMTAHVEAILDATNRGKLTEIAQLTQDLQYRLKTVSDYDTILRLASIMYFDDNESHLVYDETYNEKKIKEWKKLKIESFFLSVPLSELLPSLNLSKVDSDIFTNLTKVTSQLKIEQLERIMQSITPNNKNKDLLNSLESQISELKELILLND